MITQDEQREEFIDRPLETRLELPYKRKPGCYEVRARVAGVYFVVSFKTERDALRFFQAGIRGEASIH